MSTELAPYFTDRSLAAYMLFSFLSHNFFIWIGAGSFAHLVFATVDVILQITILRNSGTRRVYRDIFTCIFGCLAMLCLMSIYSYLVRP